MSEALIHQSINPIPYTLGMGCIALRAATAPRDLKTLFLGSDCMRLRDLGGESILAWADGSPTKNNID